MNFGSGTLYINDEPFASGKCLTEIDTLSVDEYVPVAQKLLSEQTLLKASLEVSVLGMDALMNYVVPDWGNTKQVTMQYKMPIMVQARWHKKPRVRKKWLKRFGMKPDTVKVRSNVKVLEYHPGHILEEQYDPNGIYATFNSFDFETEKLEYIWRPDQMRKELKIEW